MMTKLLKSLLTATLIASGSQAANAQLGGPSIISALPDVSSISPANAAGVLQYCVKNNLVSSSASDSVLAPLTAKHDIVSSADYAAGQAGSIITGGKTFSLGKANGFLKSQACDMVFKQAKLFK